MNVTPTNDSTATIASDPPETRASDADRDSVARLLNSAFAYGRLSAGEREQRISAAYAARTWPQLRQLTADLPAPESDGAGRPPEPFAGADRCLLCMLLIACPPAGIAWWLLSRRQLPLAPHGDVRADGTLELAAGGGHAQNR